MISNRRFMLRMIVWSLIRRRSRLLVALVGITIGATVLLGLVTLCYDIPRQLSREFRSYGANMVLVRNGGVDRLTVTELKQATDLLPVEHLVGFTPFRYESVLSQRQPFTAVGTRFEGVKKTSPYWHITGDWPGAPGEIMLGADVAEFNGLEIGRSITLDGRNSKQERYDKDFLIVGLVETGGVEDGFIFMDLEDMELMVGEGGVVDLAEVSLTVDSGLLSTIPSQISENVPGVEARLVTRVTRSEETVMSKLTALVYLVTLVVLALTMICVTTTMMTVIMERRQEIGLKKALGAENSKVANEYLAEGLFLGILGGLLGSGCGLLFARVVSFNVFGRALTPEFHLVPLTILVSAIVTVLACLAPVRRAVSIDPALVLKGE